MPRTRRISDPSFDAEAKDDVHPSHLTVQGLPSIRKNSTKSISTPSGKPSRAGRNSAVPDDVMPERPEEYLRYLSNLSTVTVANDGRREFRDVPAYLQQFEMSRRGTITTLSQPVRRRRSVQEPAHLPQRRDAETMTGKQPSKLKRAAVAVLSKHRMIGLRHILFALALAVYAVSGMFIFHAIEAPFERENVMETRDALNDALKVLAHDFSLASTIPNANTTLLLKKAYLTLLKIDGKYTGSTFFKLEDRDYPQWTWTYGTAYFFAFTLYSTVGYGSIAPSTDLGRLVVIFYTALGFPFALVIVRDLGSVLLVYITRAYAAIVRKIRHVRGFNRSSSNEGIRLPMKVAFLISFCYIVLTALFVVAYDTWLGPDPGMGLFHAFYFCFLSYAAVGLGDLMPVNYGHAPLIAIFLLCSMPLMRVINRVLYVGIENRMFGTVAFVEDSIDRIAPHEQDEGLNTIDGTIENDGLYTLDEDRSEEDDDDDEREENRIHNELRNNFTIHSSSATAPQNLLQNENQSAEQPK